MFIAEGFIRLCKVFYKVKKKLKSHIFFKKDKI